MATLVYGNDVYTVPDEIARKMQYVIASQAGAGGATWLPTTVVDHGDVEKYVMVELLVGAGIPIAFEFSYTSSEALEGALEQRAAELDEQVGE